MGDWLDIDTYEQRLWDGDEVELRDDEGHEGVGSWGFEDESWDSVWGAWHNENGDLLGFEPTHWRPLASEEENT